MAVASGEASSESDREDLLIAAKQLDAFSPAAGSTSGQVTCRMDVVQTSHEQ